MRRLTLKIFGLVQAVGYRQAFLQKARDRELRGFISNLNDGSVLAVVEGRDDYLKELIAWCYNGVDSARVERVAEEWSVATGQYTDFVIR